MSMRLYKTLAVSGSLLAILGCSGSGSISTEQERKELDAARETLNRPAETRTAMRQPLPGGQQGFAGLQMPQLDQPYLREWSVRETAADSLGRIGVDAVPELIKALGNPDAGLRVQAARALAVIGPKAGAAVPSLISLLSDDDEAVRRAAARALGQIGPAARDAIPSLIRLLQERPPVNGRPSAAATGELISPQARSE